MEKLVQVDGKIRTDCCFPTGFQDVVTLGDATKCFDTKASIDRFRVLYDVKGRFKLIPIKPSEAQFKLLKVKKLMVSDTIKYNLKTGKIVSFAKMDVGSLVMVTKGRNCGRMGTLVNKERHPGSFDIAHIKDRAGVSFATRLNNCFLVGRVNTKGDFETMLDMGRLTGIKMTIQQEADKRFGKGN